VSAPILLAVTVVPGVDHQLFRKKKRQSNHRLCGIVTAHFIDEMSKRDSQRGWSWGR
jgi:ethanolamine utilization microcompartment shell protein EutL